MIGGGSDDPASEAFAFFVTKLAPGEDERVGLLDSEEVVVEEAPEVVSFCRKTDSPLSRGTETVLTAVVFAEGAATVAFGKAAALVFKPADVFFAPSLLSVLLTVPLPDDKVFFSVGNDFFIPEGPVVRFGDIEPASRNGCVEEPAGGGGSDERSAAKPDGDASEVLSEEASGRAFLPLPPGERFNNNVEPVSGGGVGGFTRSVDSGRPSSVVSERSGEVSAPIRLS